MKHTEEPDYSVGLGDATDTHYLFKIGLAAHTIVETNDHDTIEIELLTTETVVKRYDIPRPTVIKMDIEAAELAVLNGFGSVLDNVRILYCEVHTRRLNQLGTYPAAVEASFINAGFTVEQLGERENTLFLRCIRSQ